MNVVVVGSREWTGEKAHEVIQKVLSDLRNKYSDLMVITSSTDKGVGRIVQGICLKDKTSYSLTDYNVRVYASISRVKLAQYYNARNATLLEIGEEFHVFVDQSRKGWFEDLVERVNALERRRPLYLYHPINLDEGTKKVE